MNLRLSVSVSVTLALWAGFVAPIARGASPAEGGSLRRLANSLSGELRIKVVECPPDLMARSAVCMKSPETAEAIQDRLDELLSEYAGDTSWDTERGGWETRAYLTPRLGRVWANVSMSAKKKRWIQLRSEPLSATERLAFICDGVLPYSPPSSLRPKGRRDLLELRDEVIVDVVCDRPHAALRTCAGHGIDTRGGSPFICLHEVFRRTGTQSLTQEQIEEFKEHFPGAEELDAYPQKVWMVQPKFPEMARLARMDGKVVMEATIDADGRVASYEKLRSNRPGIGFEDSAWDAVRQWRYLPAMRGETPVTVQFTVVVDFRLK